MLRGAFLSIALISFTTVMPMCFAQSKSSTQTKGRFNFSASIVRPTCTLSFSSFDQAYDLSELNSNSFPKEGNVKNVDKLVKVEGCDLSENAQSLGGTKTDTLIPAFSSDLYRSDSYSSSTAVVGLPVGVDDTNMALLLRLGVQGKNQLNRLDNTGAVLRLSYK